MKHKYSAYFSIILLFLITGCAPTGSKEPPNKPFTPIVDPNFIDLSLITGVPCSAPCWHNLTVDKSTKEETLAVLKTLTFIDQSSIKETTSNYWDPSFNKNYDSVPSQTIMTNCKNPQAESCFEFEFVNDNLKRIFIFPNYTITLQDAVTYYGAPSCVILGAWGAECAGCNIQLNWDNRQLSASVLDKRCGDGTDLCISLRHGGKIPPDYVVQTIVYYSQAWIDNDVQECFPWPGFSEENQ